MPYLTPDEDSGIKTRVLYIPTHFLPALNGAIKLLTEDWNWENFGDLSVEEVVGFMDSFFDCFLVEGQAVMRLYLARVTNSGTGNPTAHVIVNTLGRSVTWVRDIGGSPPFPPHYKAQFNAPIPQANLYVLATPHYDPSIGTWTLLTQQWDVDNPTQQVIFYPLINTSRVDLNGLLAFVGMVYFA